MRWQDFAREGWRVRGYGGPRREATRKKQSGRDSASEVPETYAGLVHNNHGIMCTYIFHRQETIHDVYEV